MMKNKLCLLVITTVLLSSVFVSSAFADSRLEDAKTRVDALLSGQPSGRLQNASQAVQARVPSIQHLSSPFLNLSPNSVNSTIQSLYVMPGSPFMSPTTGRFTSRFGWRDIGSGIEFHKGFDVANAIGTNVSAAAAGTVTFSGIKGSYGNVVMISHFIEGVEYATVYAHLSALNVSAGQEVLQGQTIGLMGSTGRSTGSHLHFELHIGEWNGGRTNAVDPAGYIKF